MIVPMKKFTLIAMQDEEDKLLSALQEVGEVQIISPPEPVEPEKSDVPGESGEVIAEVGSKKTSAFPNGGAEDEGIDIITDLSSKQQRYIDAANVLRPYTEKPGFLERRPEVTRDGLKDAKRTEIDLCVDVENAKKRITALENERKTVLDLIAELKTWEKLDTPVDKLRSSKNVKIFVGQLPGSSIVAAEQLGVSFDIIHEDKMFSVVAACHKADYDSIIMSLRELGFSDYSFPVGIKGYVRDNIVRLDKELSTCTAQLDKERDKLETLGKKASMTKLLTAADSMQAEIDRERARAELLASKSAFMLEGWVRSDRVDVVRKAVEDATDAYYTDFRDPIEGEWPPTVVQNNDFVAPFEAVVNMYSRPSPFGIDAAPVMAPFYMLFFGMMLSDSGYGLLLFIGTSIFLKLKKPKGMSGSIAAVIKWSGLATVLCGLLFGTCFGMSWKNILPIDWFPLLDPMKDAMGMLYLCCGMGLVHMLFGVGVKMYMCIKRGDTAAAVFDNLSWIFVIVGLVGVLVVPTYKQPFIIIALVGVLMLLLFAGRAKKGFGRIGKGLGSLYDVTGYLSDTVSYARVFAMGLVTGAMGEVFNTLGSMIANISDNIFGKILCYTLAAGILAAMHLFSLFINTLGTFAHTSRLQFVEYFGKFYETGGKEFLPLGYYTTYVDVKKD